MLRRIALFLVLAFLFLSLLPAVRARAQQACLTPKGPLPGDPVQPTSAQFDYTVTCGPPQNDATANVYYECTFALVLDDFSRANLKSYEIVTGDPNDIASSLFTTIAPFVKRYPKTVLTTYHSSIKGTFTTGEARTVAHDVVIKEGPIGTPVFYVNTNTFDGNITGLCGEFQTNFGTLSDYRYVWYFGDGTTHGDHTPGGDFAASSKTVYRTYDKPGSYTATLKVISMGGSNAEATYSQNVVVKAAYPAAAWQATRDAADARKFSFDASTSINDDGVVGQSPCLPHTNAGITAYDWDFGDGSIGQGVQAAHVFERGGTYNVTLKVTSRTGLTNSWTSAVTVPNQAPVAVLRYDCLNLACTFDGSGSTDDGAVTAYNWTFPDGTTATTTTPVVTRTVAAPGAYSVSLSVSDGSLTSGKVSKSFRANNDVALPSYYYALPPCRLYDGSLNPLQPSEVRSIAVAGNLHCGIPANATAVAMNFTAVNPSQDGFLAVTPAGSSVQSSLNFTAVRGSRTNDLSLRLVNGGITVRNGSGGTAGLYVDVTGYYAPAGSRTAQSSPELGYVPLNDICRAFDSRNQTSLRLNGNATAKVRMRGTCGIPQDASAAAIIFTMPQASVDPPNMGGMAANGGVAIFPSTAGSAFFLQRDTVFTSFIHSPIFPIRTGTLLTLGNTDQEDAWMEYYGGENWTDVLADVNGYFVAPSVPGALRYYPITPCRGVDGIVGQTWVAVPVQVQGNCGVPRGARAVMANVIAANLANVIGSNVRTYPTGRAWNGSSLGYVAGEFAIANGSILTLSNDRLDLTVAPDGNPIVIIDIYGYFAP